MQRFFEPRSVVLIGTSRQTGPGAYNNLEMLLSYGYARRIYLVHPKVPEILGYKTYPRVAALPDVPDLAVISLGRERLVSALRDCVQHGIKRVVVISQGLADADARGQQLQDDIVRIAREHGARVVGPNTMGILNPFSGFTTAFIDVPRDHQPPPLTLVAQSGAFQVSAASFVGRLGKAIDIGNAADVDAVDVLEYLEHDPQTKIIVMHLEGLKRGRQFLTVASRVARSKPIIVLKTGRSAAGAQAAMSHTGSLVGEDVLVDLALAAAGVIRVRTTVEMLAACRAFLHFQPLAGPRLGVVTATGAFGIIAADCCEDYGLQLAPFPEPLRKLEEERVPWHRLDNPVDLWPLGMVTGSFTGVFQRALKGLLRDDHVDGVLGLGPALASPRHADLDIPGAVRQIHQKSNPRHKPIAILLYGDEPAVRAQVRELAAVPDVACFASMDEAIMGLAATWRYRQFAQLPARDFRLPEPPAARPFAAPSEGMLVGEAAMEVLRAYDFPLVPGVLTHDAAAAEAAAKEMGYPVVLKIISPQWLHKSDMGGVALNLATADQLRQAYKTLQERFQERTPAGTLSGLLVQQQVQGTELLLGLKCDPQFGPVLVVGAGGIYTEVLQDVARALVPVDHEGASKLLETLKIFPILQGVRGQAGVNLPALAETVVKLSRLAVDYPEIQELDLNPVLAGPQGCWCVDCRIVF
ncbi:MAG: acetate--CoA ligase family protein [Deltaproteobacteria bacterium]